MWEGEPLHAPGDAAPQEVRPLSLYFYPPYFSNRRHPDRRKRGAWIRAP